MSVRASYFCQCLLVFLTAFLLMTASVRAADSLPDAVQAGNLNAAIAMLEAGTDPNTLSVDGTTALHWSVYHRNLAMTRQLLLAGANPDLANDFGATPMSLAAEHGDFAIMESLLQAGGDPESPNAEDQTLLMAVARTGRLDTAQLLLDHGANVNAKENWGGQTALMWAAAQRQPEMVRLLIEHGADVNARGKNHDWPRWVTSEPRNKPLDYGGYTPLLYAAREGCKACAEALLDGGADINLTDLWAETPLIMATLNMHYDTAALLIERGADVRRFDWWGRTALYNAIDLNRVPSSRRGDLPSTDKLTALDIARQLLERGAYPDMPLKKEPPFRGNDRGYTDGSPDSRVLSGGATALHKAAKAGDVEAVKLLLEFDAAVNLKNRVYEVTPILTAAGVWHVYGIFMETPVTGAFKTGEQAAQIMALLLDAGADIHYTGPNGQNVAHGAAKANWIEPLQFAYEQGVDFSARDVGGYTPRDLAEYMGHQETVDFIDSLLGNE